MGSMQTHHCSQNHRNQNTRVRIINFEEKFAIDFHLKRSKIKVTRLRFKHSSVILDEVLQLGSSNGFLINNIEKKNSKDNELYGTNFCFLLRQVLIHYSYFTDKYCMLLYTILYFIIVLYCVLYCFVLGCILYCMFAGPPGTHR